MEHQFLNVHSDAGGGGEGGGHRPSLDDGNDRDIDDNDNVDDTPYQQQHQPSPRSIDEYLDSAYHHSNTHPFTTQNNDPRHHCLLRFGSFLLPSQFFDNLFANWRYYIIFLALGIANSGDSSEMGCTSYILSSTTFQHEILMKGGEDLVGQRSAMIAGAHFAGMLASGLLAGIVADIRGRRYTLLLGLLNNSIVGILSSLIQNALQLCILRFITGVGLGFVIAGVVTLSAEISPPCRRGRYMTLVASCYTLGYLYTALWAILIFHLGSGNWRWFLFVNVVPTLVAAGLVYLFAPESPRFYMARGRLKEAVQMANFIARRMGYSSEEGEKSNHDNFLTEEELRKYIFQSKRIGLASFRGKEVIMHNEEYASDVVGRNRNGGSGLDGGGGREGGDDLLQEVWMSLATIKQVFVNGHWKTTVPLQLSYLSLTLITGKNEFRSSESRLFIKYSF
jgi:MFS family permease